MWISYSFSKELDVLIILKEVDDIQLKGEVSLSKTMIDNRRLHRYEHGIYIILDQYRGFIDDNPLLNSLLQLKWILNLL